MCTDRSEKSGGGGPGPGPGPAPGASDESCFTAVTDAGMRLPLSEKEEEEEEEEEEAGYGYGGRIHDIRRKEFSRLRDVAYVDHAGAPPYSEALVRECMSTLETSLLGNPHSMHDAGAATASAVEAARSATLEHFNAPLGEYEVVFTSGATAALRLVAESFPWSTNSKLQYTRVNHTSVLGIRGPAMAAGAEVAVVDILPSASTTSASSSSPAAPFLDGGGGDASTNGISSWRVVERDGIIIPEEKQKGGGRRKIF